MTMKDTTGISRGCCIDIINHNYMDTYIQHNRAKPLYRGVQVVWYILGVLEILLAFRFVLKLLAANGDAGFTSFIYGITQPFLAPFVAVFRSPRVESSVFEWTTLLAMVVYWLVAWWVTRLFVISKPVSAVEADAKLSQRDN